MAACICCTYHQLKYSSPNRSKKQNKSHTNEVYLSENGGFGKKNRLGEWANSKKGKIERATGLGRRKKEEI